MPQYATPSTASASPSLATLDTLSAALAAETRLVNDLTAVVLQQRTAIANDDIQVVDDTVFTTHRLLLTLEQARTRRRTLYRLLGYDEDVTVLNLEEIFGSRMTPELRAERATLQQAAERLSREIGINRGILQETLAQGDAYIRAVTGTSSSRAAVYGMDGTPAHTTEASISRMV